MKRIISIIFLLVIVSLLNNQDVSAGGCTEVGYMWDCCTGCECVGEDCQCWECYFYCFTCLSGTYQDCYRADTRLRRGNCSDSACNPRCEEEESHPACNNCTLPACTPPLTDTGDADLILTNYRFCRNSDPQCTGGNKYGNCYEPNTNRTQPTNPYLYIFSNPSFYPSMPWNIDFLNTSLNFSSTTTSGGINNSITGANQPYIVETSFRDSNLRGDIEAMSVWFTSGGAPATPLYVDTDGNSGLAPKSGNNSSWGFMLHKEGTSWVPYVVHIDGVNDKWVRAQTTGTGGFYVPSYTDNSRLALITPSVTDGDAYTKILRFSVNMYPTTSPLAKNTTYNVFTMSHDVFSFTPYDNYPATVTNIGAYWQPEQLRYPRQWVDTTKDWRLDLQSPTVNSFSSVLNNTQVQASWTVSDTAATGDTASGVYAVVINAYRPAGSAAMQPIIINSTPYNVPELPTDVAQTAGYLDPTRYAYRASTSGSLTIDLGTNTSGTLILYLTVFDNAGNIARSQLSSAFDFRDWIITQGDIFYSSTGIDSPVKAITPDTAWSTTKLSGLFTPSTSDISSELYAVGNASGNKLIKSGTNKSYAIQNYINPLGSASLYTTYKESFDERKDTISNLTRISTSPLAGSLGTSCNPPNFCYGEYTTLTVNSNFICNGRAIFFVSGNLTINPNITNTNANRDACIFIVGGNVTITAGGLSTSNYDEINTYIIADGRITISADSNGDGLLVKGGLVSKSLTTPSILINRHLAIARRSIYPVLAVSAHPKYQYLSKIFVGTPLNVVIGEVGFKGY